MIFVGKKKEPATFHATVRLPGHKALAGHSGPITRKFWKGNDFWTRCRCDLYTQYGAICAYLGLRLNNSSQLCESVEHFIPKSCDPSLAYEWDNFRLVSSAVNKKRGNKTGILDPFCITDDMFTIWLNTGLVRANPSLPHGLQQQIYDTINILGINDTMFCDYRKRVYERYITKPESGIANPDALLDEAPFVWLEAVHQRKIVL